MTGLLGLRQAATALLLTVLFGSVLFGAAGAAHAGPASPAHLAGANPAEAHPPIPVFFTLKQPGYVTLVIDDAQGRRVRNLISETYYPHAGRNVAYWDGLDDTGRVPISGLSFALSPKMVQAGVYHVRGLVRPAITVRYQMTPYNPGVPPWDAADRSSGWLANHTPPQAALWVPEAQAAQGPGGDTPGGQVMVGSYVTEGGSGLAWLDMNGRKRFGQYWIGGVWTGAPYLARDSGPHPQDGVYAYAASAWADELRLAALVTRADKAQAPRDTRMGSGDDRPVLTPTWKFPGGGGAWNSQSPNAAVTGLAARNGLIVAALPKINQLLFVDAVAGKALGTVALADPRGLAFDAQGRLLALSGTTLCRFTLPDSLRASQMLNEKNWTATASVHPEDAQKPLGNDPAVRWSTNGWQKPGAWYAIDMKTPQAVSTLILTTAATQDSPAGYQVSTSTDGATWSAPIAQGTGTPGTTVISFSPVITRFLKITQTGTTNNTYWSINSLRAMIGPDPAIIAPLLDTASVQAATHTLPGGETVIAQGLIEPQGITLDTAGNIYVSDGGDSQQVKVFSPAGALLRTIGHPGAPGQGPYDPLHMNHPTGITIDGQGRLWVAEDDFQPKRVSEWDAQTGRLLHAWYGPYSYGGGGVLDPRDRNTFYYAGMKFRLDWKTGEAQPVDVYYRSGVAALDADTDYGGLPTWPLYAHGHEYLTGAFTRSPTNGATFAILWEMQPNGVAQAVAACGRANDWPVLQTDAFRARWPQGANPASSDYWGNKGANQTLFSWNDLNGDGKMEPSEVTMIHAGCDGVTLAPDLSFVVSVMDPQGMGGSPSSTARAMRYAPVSFTAAGAPRYELSRGQVVSRTAQGRASTGMGQALLGTDGWLVQTTAPPPFSPAAVGGSRNGVARWQYPSLWPGLHPSHEAPMPDHPGELIGTTRLLGQMVTPRHSDAGPIWAINGNKGNVYLFTQDGLFVATLFQDSRTKAWDAPQAVPGMSVNDLSLQEESFYPSLTQTAADGRIWLQGNGCLLSVSGLEGIRRLPDAALTVSPSQLAAAQTWFAEQEAMRQRQQAAAQTPLIVRMLAAPPSATYAASDWPDSAFVPIDDHASAALAVAGNRLYAVFKTGDPHLLKNSPETLQNLFHTGGGLDLMLNAIPGGERLLATQVGDKTVAVLYRPRVPGTTSEPVKFVSNIGTLKTVAMDRVDDVSDQVTLTSDGQGNYELSVPLALLSLSPQAGASVGGDIGLLRGDGFQTLQRVYWHNKATGLVSDLASEAELTPNLWGTWTFR